MQRRDALKIAGGATLGLLGASAGGLAWLKHWSDPQTPLHYAFSPESLSPPLAPTPARAHVHPTDAEIEGPFYTPNTPRRTALAAPGTVGTPLVIVGRVLTPDGLPVAGAVLDVWNCDGRGVYDTDGFNLRGHQYTDASGTFRVETVKPGDYHSAGLHRTPHVHVKAQGRETRLLTTQLYFPGEPLNAHDFFFDPDLVLRVQLAAGGSLAAQFTIVLAPRA